LQESSLTDPLPGPGNRRYLFQRIGADVAATLASHAEPSLKATDMIFFMVDIDQFKEVNDRWGHDAGDAVLQQMRARLESVFRDSDHLVRWVGEEFLLVDRATSRQRACEPG